MLVVVSWDAESSYEAPTISRPYDSLEAIAEGYGPGDCADNRHDEGTLYYTRVFEGQGENFRFGFSEISDSDVQTLKELADALDPSYAEQYGSPYGDE